MIIVIIIGSETNLASVKMFEGHHKWEALLYNKILQSQTIWMGFNFPKGNL